MTWDTNRFFSPVRKHGLLMTLTSLMYTVKRVDGKLRQTDWMTQFSSIRGTEHFLDMQIELIRQVSTMKMINKKDHGDEHHFCMTLMGKNCC
jgi:hypothetical protein